MKEGNFYLYFMFVCLSFAISLSLSLSLSLIFPPAECHNLTVTLFEYTSFSLSLSPIHKGNEARKKEQCNELNSRTFPSSIPYFLFLHFVITSL